MSPSAHNKLDVTNNVREAGDHEGWGSDCEVSGKHHTVRQMNVFNGFFAFFGIFMTFLSDKGEEVRRKKEEC